MDDGSNPPRIIRMYNRNERISRESYENASKIFSEGDGGAKDTSRSGSCKISKRSKIENASIALAPTALVLEKSATRGPKQGKLIAL